MRPSLRISIAYLYPLPTSPITSSAGTRTSSKRTGHVLDARIPSLSSFLPTLSPGASAGTTKVVMPLYPASGLAFAITTKTPDCSALLIHIFSPLRMKSSPSRTALVRSAKASEPLPASESAKDETVSCASRGSHFSLSRSDAHMLNTLLLIVLWMSTIAATDGSMRASSSITMHEQVNVEPAPPCSSAISTPISPVSNSIGMSAGSICAASSIWRTRGASSA